MTADQLGIIGSAMLFAYAFGKCTNGFLADRANIKRFMTLGLAGAAIINITLGFCSIFWVFVVLWGLHGWFQSMGAAPCIVSLSQWFPPEKKGTLYGWWSMSHYIGKGIIFVCTAMLVSFISSRYGLEMGWRSGFFGAGAVGIIACIILYLCLHDRPETYGLPPIEEAICTEFPPDDIGKHQWEVIKNPAVWVIGLSSALMYIARYAIEDWGILYLQKVKGYGLPEAGILMGIGTIPGIAGSIMSGWISDRFFNSHRGLPCVIFGLLQVASMFLLFFAPGGFIVDEIAISLFFFATGALLVYLGGLIAVDLASKKAAGAAMGIIGIFSYIGAGIQDIISGHFTNAGITIVNGHEVYDFSNAITFWICASIASTILTAGLFGYGFLQRKFKQQPNAL